MRWTADMDARLLELHAKRLGNTFIASWLRVTTFDVRARLVELGLRPAPGGKAPFAQAVSAPQSAAAAPSPSDAEIASGEAFADDADAEERVQPAGRPRGHLVSESDIAAIYRRAGRGY